MVSIDASMFIFPAAGHHHPLASIKTTGQLSLAGAARS